MSKISSQTAMDIALAYREVNTAKELLAEIDEARSKYKEPDIRDAFGRRVDGLELSVPSSSTSRCCYNVPWTMAKPIIEAHIAQQEALISALSEKAKIEMAGGQP